MTREKNVQAVIAALLLTSLTFAVSSFLGADVGSVTLLEWAAVFTSFASTFLCVIQSRINYIWGVVSVVLYTYLFYTVGLFSSAVLNAYLVPVLIWGWFRWRSDEQTRPVEFVGFKWWPAYIGFAFVVWFGLSNVSAQMGAALPKADSAILILSVLAQALLDQKKPENWGVWLLVNIFATFTYYQAGLHMVAVQYFLFGINTIIGAAFWLKSMRVQNAV